MAENKYYSIVVGGGMAGLTCAAFLAKEGRRVLLIEKNRECGGLVNTFSHNGFQFDAGIRALENAGIIFPMLNDLGIKLDVVKSLKVSCPDKIFIYIANIILTGYLLFKGHYTFSDSFQHYLSTPFKVFFFDGFGQLACASPGVEIIKVQGKVAQRKKGRGIPEEMLRDNIFK